MVILKASLPKHYFLIVLNLLSIFCGYSDITFWLWSSLKAFYWKGFIRRTFCRKSQKNIFSFMFFNQMLVKSGIHLFHHFHASHAWLLICFYFWNIAFLFIIKPVIFATNKMCVHVFCDILQFPPQINVPSVDRNKREHKQHVPHQTHFPH